jgi:hypothetical protein
MVGVVPGSVPAQMLYLAVQLGNFIFKRKILVAVEFYFCVNSHASFSIPAHFQRI